MEPRSDDAEARRVVRFGRYTLDRDGLWRGKQEARLTPKALAVLRILVDRAGRLVSKQELLDIAWSGTAVSDATLSSCVQEIRRVLGDDARRPRFLATVHRRGFRFVATQADERPPSSATPAMHSTAPPPPIVGRDRDLDELCRWLALVEGGDRQVVFVAGEPGIGKTALVETFVHATLATRSPRIGRGQCVEHYGAGEAYLPILESLGRLCREPDGGERVVKVLAQYAPTWLTQMPSVIRAADHRAVERTAQGATRERMLRELAEAVDALAADRTLILFLEDLHWSDVSTLDWIASVARRPERARLLVIGTYRPLEVLSRDHPLHAVKQELQLHRRCRELVLRPFDEPAVAEYLARRCPVGPGQSSSLNRLARAIHARTEGNPLFVVNVVDDLVDGGVLVDRRGEWVVAMPLEAVTVAVPVDVRQMIERQLQRLKSNERHMLEGASVIGTDFSAAAVAAATFAPAEEVEECFAALVWRQHFLRTEGTERWPDGTLATRFQFLHALYREVVYDQLAPGLRAALHARVGARLETAHGARAAEIAALLALHFDRSGDVKRAISYLDQAGRNAGHRAAPREATMHLGRALELLATLPATANLPGTPEILAQTIDIRIAYAASLMAMKGVAAPEVGAFVLQTYELARRCEDAGRLFGALWQLWLVTNASGRYGEALELARRLLALAESDSDDSMLLEGHHALWTTMGAMGETVASLPHCERGIALYDPTRHAPHMLVYGTHDAGVCGRYHLALAYWFLGYPDRATATIQDALYLAEKVAHGPSLVQALGIASFIRYQVGDHDAAWESAERMIALAKANETIPWVDNGLVILAGVEARRRGDYRRLNELSERLAELGRGAPAWRRAINFTVLAECLGDAGNVERGLTALDAIPPEQRDLMLAPEVRRVRGDLLLRRNEREHGEREFHAAIEMARHRSERIHELRATVSLARLWRQQGRSEEARRMLSESYRWFREGFDTRDLREAKVLLDELA